MSDSPVEVRVGDRERAAVDEQLRTAVGDGVLTLAEYDERAAVLWQARTRRELDALLLDLPRPARDRAPAAPPAAPGPARPSLLRRTARRLGAVGVTGALALAAVGVVASGTDGRAVFGSATTPADDSSVSVSVLFGSVRVVVPDDAQVDTGGLVVFGSVDCATACSAGQDGPRIDVRSLGGFGSVEILTESEAAADVDLDEDDD